jgi:hypothetical protein
VWVSSPQGEITLRDANCNIFDFLDLQIDFFDLFILPHLSAIVKSFRGNQKTFWYKKSYFFHSRAKRIFSSFIDSKIKKWYNVSYQMKIPFLGKER